MAAKREIDDVTGRELVSIARRGLERYVNHKKMFAPDLAKLPALVQAHSCSFVTLTNDGRLRGCIGSTKPSRPLAEDVARHAASAARDPRFAPVKSSELADIRLEVTLLTVPQPLPFSDYPDLLGKLRPMLDGVILTRGVNRGVLLPQVWHRIPKPAQFITVLARKAGIPLDALQNSPSTVYVEIFQVQHFEEPGYREPGG